MQRKDYIYFLKVLSALAVVLLHTNGCFWSFSYEQYWISANIIESVFYFAVPIFFMVSGITLMDYRERYDTKTYLKKRIVAVVIPFVVWSIIALLYSIRRGRVSITDLTFISVVNGIINSEYQSVYWFFIPLITIYLSIPFISIIDKDKRKSSFKYIILLYCVFNSLLPLICKLIGIDYNGNLYIPIAQGSVIWVFIGYYLDTYGLSDKNKKILYILGLFGLLIHIGGTWYLSYQIGAVDGTFKGYTNIPSILYCSALYIFIKENYHTIRKSNIANKIISWFKNETFGVYLIHHYIIDIFIFKFVVNPQSLVYRLGGGLLIFIICTIIIKILHRIPIVRKIC